MLKRSCPRFMTCAVTANGNPSPSALLIFPVTRKPSSGSSPRATVPAMRGRADMPSAKKSLGSSGSYLGCTAIFWRQATSNIVIPSTARNPLRACARGSLADCAARDDKRSPRDIGDLPRIERLQKIPRLVEIELRIARLDHQKKFVARRLIESRHVEHRA